MPICGPYPRLPRRSSPSAGPSRAAIPHPLHVSSGHRVFAESARRRAIASGRWRRREKSGVPTTYEHCWGKGRWVERFFDALEANADWLTTVRPSDWLDGRAPIGRVYVPTGSYAEMGEWALPADESREFAEALHRAREAKAPEERWLRGAFWRNFQVKYREINDLHKQMLRTSAKVEAMVEGRRARPRSTTCSAANRNDCCYGTASSAASTSPTFGRDPGASHRAEDLADAGGRRAGRERDSRSRPRRTRRAAAVDDGQWSSSSWTRAPESARGTRAARHALTGVMLGAPRPTTRPCAGTSARVAETGDRRCRGFR